MDNNKEDYIETGLEIAIIGLAGRFPNAKNIKEFWENLKNGVESISFFSDDELKEAGVSEEPLKAPNYVKTGAFLEEKEYFDAPFFGYSPKEADTMDPQMRLFHQCCWEGLEDAGYDPISFNGLIGIYAGAANSFIWEALSLATGKQEELGSYAANLLTRSSIMATRISHKLDLKGPALNIFTTCSTSLVAVHLACRALLTGECDMALAGGVSLFFQKKFGYMHQEGMIFSPDGHCRAFDAKAKGAVFGEGLGVVVLKRLSDSTPDNDNIYAVIKGSAVNNDGKVKVSYVAPAKKGQENVIKTALDVAQVTPESISYVETHGTGTIIGDPIEMEALIDAFAVEKKKFCAIGSVKNNVGHLDVAAGITGLIKTALALKYRVIPPCINYETPNPNIDFENSPFYVNTGLSHWKSNRFPLRAGVSSFGIGGTNAHIILEEAPGMEPSANSSNQQVIVLSARTGAALGRATGNLAQYFKENCRINIADAAYTLQVGRRVFKHRKVAICSTLDEAIEQLSGPQSQNLYRFVSTGDNYHVAFMFPGQGSQYVNMGLDLYRTERLFREEIDHCFKILKPLMGYDIKDILYPSPSVSSVSSVAEKINQTEIAQPLLFVIEYALAKMLMKWEIKPHAMIGHSIGEYVAACLAGVFSLEDALTLVVWRGKLMQQMPEGAMLSVPIDEDALRPLLDKEISIAAVNTSSRCVVSGAKPAINKLSRQLKEKGYQTRLLHTSHAFHSRMMDPILDKFQEKVKQIKLNPPQIPYISNVIGGWAADGVTDPAYWVRQLRSTVRFSPGLSVLLKKGNSVFVEIGPGNTLSTFVNQHQDTKPGNFTVNLIRHSKKKVQDDYYLLSKIGQLWMYGTTIDWKKFHENRKERPYRISLPTYPFERQPYWIEESSLDMVPRMIREKSRKKKKKNPTDWLYCPSWTRSLLPLFNDEDDKKCEPSVFLVFIDDMGLGDQILHHLKEKEQIVISVKAGLGFAGLDDSQYIIDPHQAEDYIILFQELRNKGKLPGTIVHLWNITAPDSKKSIEERLNNVKYTGFFSLIYQARAIEILKLTHTFRIIVVSNHIQELTGEEDLYPEKSIILGPIKVIPQECRNISCRSIDILYPSPAGQEQDKELVNRLLPEFSHEPRDTVVAYRGKHRWVQNYVPVPVKKNHKVLPPLRSKGVYLLTGGLGNIGLTLAEYLAKTVNARLVLTGRSVFPPRCQWNELLDENKNHRIARKIKKLQDIEKLGAELLVKSADVADEDQMQRVIQEAGEKFGPIDGVIHCAGIVGEQSRQAISDIKPIDWEKHARPKIHGLLVLEKLFKNRPLDFCFLMSSLSSVLGGLGFCSYAAANIFMDAYALYCSRNNQVPWLSIDWEGWNFNEKEGPTGTPGTPNNEISTFSLTLPEGEEIFEKILAWHSSPQVIVSTGHLDTRVDRWIKFESLWEEKDDKQSESKTFQHQARPHLSQPYVAPQSQLEKQVAHIWREFLGVEPVGTLDNFFELGGDSLKAVTLLGKLHKTLNIAVPIDEFFNRSTVKELTEYIKGSETSIHISINPVEKKEYYSLSSAQKRLYILQQLDLESVGYNQYQVVLLEGKPDRNKLERAFRELIQRHEVLRTSIIMANDEAVQQIHDHVEFEIEYYDSSCESAIYTFMRPFVLSHPPFFRVGFMELKENKHILMLDMHHIITDGFSVGIFVKELMLIYGKQVLPAINLHYKDYSEWQNKKEQQEFIKSQEKFWLKEFEGEIPVLELPTDYPRPAVQDFKGNSLNFELGGPEVKRLKEMGAVEDATLFMVIIAIFNIFLTKLSGREDIVIGSPLAGRGHTDLQNIMGIFVNSLALRNRPNGQKTFQIFLKEVKKNALKAFENQDYPFEELVEQVSVERDLSRNPLFDVMFVLQNIELTKVEIPGLKLSPYEHKRLTSKFDLELSALEAGEKLLFSFEYCTKLFKQETIERFISYFKKIVASVLIEPGIKILDIEIISDREKKQILFDFNDTEADYPQEKTIHRLFEEQVEQTPDHIALVGIHETHEKHEKNHNMSCLSYMSHITYHELNHKSHRLANLLIEKGVGPDSIVGIMLDRSIEMIIGIMGILKASGAYLPIDPDYPQERVDYMLKDSGARILLKKSEIRNPKSETKNERAGVTVLDFEHLNFEFVSNFEFRASNLSSSELAYIIYTSGSTGKPKGVIVEHRSVVNRLNWMQQAYPIGPGDVILQKTAFTFDVSVWELFWWSFQGASVCLLARGDEKAPGAIIEAIERNNVTTIHFVPSILNAFLEYLESLENLKGLSTLKHLFASGEALSVHHVETFNRLFNKKNKTRLINLYGPTEATVDVSYFNCPSMGKIDKIPIGKPIDNIRLYVVNKGMNLQPIEIPGELCISGVGLARGYLNNPQLTLERFTNYKQKVSGKKIYKSYGSHRSYILYRTGDLARWLPDGNIEFLGRIDHQVKIRGFRIELGEIEAQLVAHGEIKGTVVTAKTDKNGDTYLCAYIVSKKEFTVSHLRSYLSKKLPDYMLPSFFIPVDKIPLTSSGKLDRKKLPEPGAMDLSGDMVYVGPGNALEIKLVEIWQKVLGISTVSINDNFFEIGGDSIKTIQLVSRMKKAGYKIEMRDIFRNPRISKLAPLVKKIERIADQSIITGTVPLTPIQKRFFENQIIDSHHYNQAVMVVLEEGFDQPAIKAVFTKIQEHHDALRMIYTKDNGKVIQFNQGLVHPVSLQVFDFRNRNDAGSLIENKVNEIQASINLETGPLMKLGLFRLDDGDRLLIVAHHLVIDGVSWRILFEDIAALYRQYKRGKSLILPLKTDAFKVWSEKLCEYANSDQFLKEKNYWVQLESKSIPQIRKDFENEDNYMKDVESLSFTLEEIETHILLTKTNEAFGTGINDILLTALGLGIKKNFGNDRLLIAMEGHGREEILEDIDASRTVGWFTSLYPVLLDFSYENEAEADRNLARQIKEVKENLRQVPHNGVGYGILKYLTAEKNKEGIHFTLNPRVIFNYLGQFDEDLEHRSFRIAKEPAGFTRSQNEQRDVDLEVSGIITGKRLTISISYSSKQYKQETITELLENFKRELAHIITYCSSRETKELTPSDLTCPEISIEALDQLQEQYSYLIEDVYPLTPMQEGMLFYALIKNKNRTTYFEQMSYRLQGQLNVPLVEKSLNELFKLHDVLRTVFIHEGLNRPLQVVLKERNVEFYFEDLRKSISNHEIKETLVSRFNDKDRRRSFDLSKDVLMRVAVLQLEDYEYQVTWSSHHILMDGWCIGILISEFFEIYTSCLENRTFQLPTIKPYRTYIQWLEKQEKDKTGNYWKNYLENYEEIAAVPRKENKGTFEGGYQAAGASIRFEEEKTTALNKVAIRSHVTLNTVLQAIWAIVLGKYCSKQDIVFGVLISGRPPEIEGVESMIGCFINTIPVRITFDQKTTFNQLLRIIQDRAIESETHYYYSLAEIQAESPLKQNLLDHIIEFQNYPPAERIEGVGDQIAKNKTTETLKLSNVNVSEQSNYDFNVVIVPGDQIDLSFGYNANVYDSELVHQLGLNCIRILEQIIEDDKIAIDEIAFLSEEEKRKILFEFNNNKAGFPRDKTIYQFVEKHAENTPDRTAIVGKEERRDQGVGTRFIASVTCRELNERANQLAILLRNSGIQKDEPVGILMERSQAMAVSILATWKAGGAYMPIDPDYPGERIDHILSNSKTKVLVTTQDLSTDIKFEKEIIFLSDAINRVPTTPHQHLSPAPVTSLAYIIYTSGSTGKPKGVMIEHIGMMNHIQAKINDLQLTPESIVAQNATHTFDISVWQFFAALIPGGRTVIYPDQLIMDPGRFLSRLLKDQITILEVVPSYLSVLLDYITEQVTPPLSLQYLLVTGEEIKPHLVKKWFDKYPKIKMVNAYGPTEASDDITHYIMDKAPDMAHIPIGKPVQNMNIYIVDNRMQLCPIGVKGEICVSGVGVGRGYLGDEEKTKQVFIKNPFEPPTPNNQSSSPYSTIYLTGDLGAWLPDGNIEFFGRKDYQVKIRGFRIELGEIENRLLNHPEIKEAVVIDRTDEIGNKYLCAYIVAQRETHGAWPIELREFLSKTLPDYMVPDHFMRLENIPLTSSGKVDRKALPEPEGDEITSKYVAPGNHLEKKLVEIWSDVLGKEEGVIGVNHNFFDLGGHSLKAIVLVSKIHKEFDVKVPLAELFRTPTIRLLSQYIKKAVKDRFASIESLEKKEYYSLSSAQKRLYVLQQMDLDSHAYNLPEVISLAEDIDLEKLKQTFTQLIQRHESLRTSFHLVNDQPVQKVHDLQDVEFKIEYYDMKEAEVKVEEDRSPVLEGTRGLAPLSEGPAAHESQLAARIKKDFICPFDLTQAPLLKVGIIRQPDYTNLLVVVMHHIISDGTSHIILVKDFMTIHENRELPPLRIQYKDFSQWQNKEKIKETIKRQELYWLKEFAGEIPVLNIPTDYTRPAVRSFEGDSFSFDIGRIDYQSLKKYARIEGVTLFILLLAITHLWLYKLSSQEDIVVGTPIAGRRHADLEKIMGMFVNTLALRNYPNGKKTFQEFLREVKHRTLDALENQEYQFEDLVDKVGILRDLGRNPLFDVMFIFQDIGDDTEAKSTRKENQKEDKSPKQKPIPEQQQIEDIRGTARFDLTLTCTEPGEKPAFSVGYCTKLFKKETIQRFVTYFKKIVSAIANEPGILLWKIDILEEKERNQLLYDFNDTTTEYPNNRTLHELFAEQVKKTPNHTALVGIHETHEKHNNNHNMSYLSYMSHISYKELNKKSHQLAHLLKEKGIGPDSIVAIMMARSVEMIIGILGILKAGGAYLPIDPDYPKERIAYMVADSAAKISLTSDAINRVPTPHLLSLHPSTLPPFHPSNPSTLCYIIYTSGTTGKPKGIMIEHRSAVNYTWWAAKTYVKNEKTGFPLYTSISFDLTITSIFTPLITGNRVIVYQYEEGDKEPLIQKVIDENRVGIIKLTPSHLRLIRHKKEKWTHPCIKQMIVGGEDLPADLAKEVSSLFPSVEIYNEYGPTEATVGCMIYKFNPETDRHKSVPIGIPADNVKIYLLDKNRQPVPPGIPGEIHIAGHGTARGYLNQPELTAEKFCLRRPVGTLEGTGKGIHRSYRSHRSYIFYRTGDLGRLLPDGNIEFLGRIDQQVKIRGFRVELGEIESQLIKHPSVKETVLVTKTDNTDNTYILAYFVSDEELITTELRDFLLKKMPYYMIPSYFFQLETIPLTPNGKVDMTALTSIDDRKISSGVEYAPPRNEIEKKLVSLWAQVLELKEEQIGIYENFFDLGGHSIKAIQLIAKTNQENLNLSLQDIFKYPTAAALSDYIILEKKGDMVFRQRGKINEEEVERQNQDFEPDNYPYYFPCLLGIIREKLKYEQHYDIDKSIFLTANGSAILGLGYECHSGIKEKLKYTEYPLEQLTGLPSIQERLGYRIKRRVFPSLQEQLEYCQESLNRQELVLLTGTTYFLNYTPDYHLDEAQWMEKMNNLFAYRTPRQEQYMAHSFILAAITKDSYIVADTIYSYYGKVPKEDFHKAVKSNKAIEFSKGHVSYDAYPSYEVLELDTNQLKTYNSNELELEILKKTALDSLNSKETMYKLNNTEYVAFIGLSAIKELDSIIENCTRREDDYNDLLTYVTQLTNAWKYKAIFLRDTLQDFSKHFVIPGKTMPGIQNTIQLWDRLYNDLDMNKENKNKFPGLFEHCRQQLKKIYDEQEKFYSELIETIRGIEKD